MKTFHGGGGMGPWRTPVYQPWFSKASGSAGIRVRSWESGASMTHPKLAGTMGCLVLGGGEQMELGEALDRSWKSKLGDFLTPGGLWVPTSTLPQQMQTPTFRLGFSLSLAHPEQQRDGVMHSPVSAGAHRQKPSTLQSLADNADFVRVERKHNVLSRACVY